MLTSFISSRDNNLADAPLGMFLPLSHAWIVFFDTPSQFARNPCVVPVFFRISYFQNCSNRSELVRAYRKWVKELHPDNGGNPEDFIRMSNEYDRLKTRYAC